MSSLQVFTWPVDVLGNEDFYPHICSLGMLETCLGLVLAVLLAISLLMF